MIAWLLVIMLTPGPSAISIPDLPSEGACRQLYQTLKIHPKTGWWGDKDYSCTHYEKAISPIVGTEVSNHDSQGLATNQE